MTKSTRLAIRSAHVSVHLYWPTSCVRYVTPSSPFTMSSTPGTLGNSGLRRVRQLCPSGLVHKGSPTSVRSLHVHPLHHCQTIVHDALRSLLGPRGFLCNYVDDVYMGGQPVLVAHTLTLVLGIYADVGLSLGWGPKKTKLVLQHIATLGASFFPATCGASPSRTSCMASKPARGCRATRRAKKTSFSVHYNSSRSAMTAS